MKVLSLQSAFDQGSAHEKGRPERSVSDITPPFVLKDVDSGARGSIPAAAAGRVARSSLCRLIM